MKKNLDFYCFVTSLWLFISEERCKCNFKKGISLKTWWKKIIFFVVDILKVTVKKSRSESGSLSSRYGSKDPNPYQNVADPENWKEGKGSVRRYRYLAQLEPQVVIKAGGNLGVFLLRIAGSQHTEHRPLVGIAALPHRSPAGLERLEKNPGFLSQISDPGFLPSRIHQQKKEGEISQNCKLFDF
jgi:hypothetical protein